MKINKHNTLQNKLKDKNNRIISLGGEKAFDKIQHNFMIKVLEGYKGCTLTYSLHVVYSKPSDGKPKWRETQSNSTRIKSKTRFCTLSMPIQHGT